MSQGAHLGVLDRVLDTIFRWAAVASDRCRASAERLWPSYHDVVARDPAFLAASKWARRYVPKSGVEYAGVMEYAARRYERLLEDMEALDRKADDLVRYVGTITPLVAGVVAAASVIGPGWLLVVLMAPPLALLVLAAGLAAVARAPAVHPIPGQARQIVRAAEGELVEGEQQTGALIAVLYHCAAVALRAFVEEKARRVGRAYWAFIGALLAFVPSAVLCGVLLALLR